METIKSGYTRVSSILAMIPTKDNDNKWYFPMQQIDPEVLSRKAALGSLVHAAIAADANDEFFPVDDQAQGYLKSYWVWKEALKVTPIATEQRIYHEDLKITGCLDMCAQFGDDDKSYLVDFKCTVSPDHVKWSLQAAFYHLIASANGYTLESICYFVQLDPHGGEPKVHQYIISKHLLQVAISLYNTYIFLTK